LDLIELAERFDKKGNEDYRETLEALGYIN